MSDAAARGAATTVSGQWIRFLVQLASLVVLARLLTPNDFGTVAMVTSIAGFATVLGDFGLSLAAIQAQEITRQQRSNLFWLNVSIGIASAGLLIALAGPIASFYGNPAVEPIVRWLSVLFLVNAAQSQYRAEASRELKFKWLALSDVIAVVAAFIAAVGVAWFGGGYWALVVQQYTVAIVTLAVLVISVKWLPGLPTRNANMRPLLFFGANTLGVQAINYASSNVDTVLLGRFWGAAVVGLYDRAFQLFRIPMLQIAAPMTRVAFPILARTTDPVVYDRYLQKAQLVLTYVIGGAFFIASALASPLIDIALGSTWDASKDIFRVLALGGVFQIMSYVYYWIFLSKALMSIQLRYSLIGRTIMVLLIVAGLPFGAVGVALGSAGGLAVLWLIYSTFAVRKAGIDVRPLLMTSIRPITVYAVMLALVLPVDLIFLGSLDAWAELAVLVGAIGAYFGLAFISVPPLRRDFAEIVRIAKKMRRR